MRVSPITLAPALALALVAASCGGATTASPTPTTRAATASASRIANVAAVGQTSTKLADGTLAALPAGTLYVNFLAVPQPPASPITHAHVAGFVYAVVGTHQLAIQGGETKDIKPGEAGFIGTDVAHTHANPGSTPTEWYFVALRPVAGRTAAPLFPGQTVLFETADLPQLTAGKYAEQLNVVTLDKGGQTAAHKHGGLETVVVLEGTVQVRVAGAQPVTLTKGKGLYIAPNTPLQAINMGDGTAKFLAFFVTLDGQTFSTNVDAAP
jgi:quercetin dioxygenase-like cupin family protein